MGGGEHQQGWYRGWQGGVGGVGGGVSCDHITKNNNGFSPHTSSLEVEGESEC